MVEVGRDLERSYGSNKKESAVFVTTAELAASVSSLKAFQGTCTGVRPWASPTGLHVATNE